MRGLRTAQQSEPVSFRARIPRSVLFLLGTLRLISTPRHLHSLRDDVLILNSAQKLSVAEVL
jgi:hypothetical protein